MIKPGSNYNLQPLYKKQKKGMSKALIPFFIIKLVIPNPLLKFSV